MTSPIPFLDRIMGWRRLAAALRHRLRPAPVLATIPPSDPAAQPIIPPANPPDPNAPYLFIPARPGGTPDGVVTLDELFHLSRTP